MKSLGAGTFVAASLVAHVAVGGVLLSVRPPPDRARKGAIVVEVRRRERPPEVVPPAAPPPLAPPPLAPPVPPPPRQATRSAPPPPVLAPPPAPTPPPPAPPVDPARKPDLFAQLALERVVSSTAGTIALTPAPAGGTTRSADRGDRDPNARDAIADREHASGVLRDMIGDHQQRGDVQKGKVAPRWRQAERAMYDHFRPSPDTISDESTASNMWRSWANTRPQGGSTPRGVDESLSGPGFLGAGAAGSTFSEIPDDLKRRTEVEVELAPDGSIVRARVKRHSGRPQFDTEALALVRSQLENGGPLDDKKGVVMLWAVDAWVLVAPPSPVGGFTFDEVSGKVSASHPLKKNVGQSVSLLSVRALD